MRSVADEAELFRLLDLEARERARDDFITFLKYTNPRFQAEWYHRVFADALQDAANWHLDLLIVSVPPRHGKSEMVSRGFPAWLLGRNPDTQIISASYSADLSSRMNRDVQRIIGGERYAAVFPDTRLGEANIRTVAGASMRNSEMFEVVGYRGVYRSAGVGGGITGMGANFGIIDDPIKNQEEARSEVIREKVWEWFTSTLLTRLENPGVLIVVMTRWHEDDLVGRLLAQIASDPSAYPRVRVIDFPAIKESDDNPEDPRQIGEALWPGSPDKPHYPLSKLNKIRASVGEAVWASLYQQRPSPAGGGIFREANIRYWYPTSGPTPAPVRVRLQDGSIFECIQVPRPDRFDQVLTSWDLTFKDTKGSDFVAGTVQGKLGPNAYVLDIYNERADVVKSMAAIKAMAAKWPEARAHLIEDKANGPAVITMLRQHIPGIIPVEPEGGKEARANAVSPYFEGGNVYLPHPAVSPKAREMVSQMLAFPNGAHDDMVDALSQGLNRLYGKRVGRIAVVDGWGG